MSDSPRVTATYEGPDGEVRLRAHRGVSVAAALIDAGVLSWRTTRHGEEPRGLFCGIGSCFDCLVMLNGRPNVRACLAQLEHGDVVTPQRGAERD